MKQVNVTLQMIIAFVPILNLYGYYRINKLMLGLVFIPMNLVIGYFTQNILPYPFGFILGICISVPIQLYFMRRWSLEYNSKVSASLKQAI